MEIKTVGDFVDLVEKTLDTQQKYFRTRSPAILEESKQLESELRAVIKKHKEKRGNADNKQHDLFKE